MEASAIQARAGVGGSRVRLATPLLKLRSDQQLVGLFRAGNEDAFRVIHDRYRARLLAYIRQMLVGGPHPDSEDVLQDVFVRAYAGLRTNGRELSLRPWMYRIAHNRCIDELRRPVPAPPEPLEVAPALGGDPVLASEQRESLRRLIVDIRRLPDQQRSALLMRELSGMAYGEIAGVLALSVPAVKSLLVRARIGLAAAHEARDTSCREIQSELAAAHDRGVRASGLARRHLHDCSGCRQYRSELRHVSRQLAALTPIIGPIGVLARLIGLGSGAGGGAAAGGTGSGVVAAGGAASAGGTFLGVATTHVAAVVTAAVVTAGGAVEIQRTVADQLSPPAVHHVQSKISVGQATSAEGTVAATVVAPLSSATPAPAIAAPAPAGQTRRSRAVAVPSHRQRRSSARNSPSASANGSAPSQSSTAPTAGTGTQAAGASAGEGSTTTVCPSTPSTTVTPVSPAAPCPPTATPKTGGSAGSTTTGSSTGSDPTVSGGTTLTSGSSMPVSGTTPSSPGTTTPPQKS